MSTFYARSPVALLRHITAVLAGRVPIMAAAIAFVVLVCVTLVAGEAWLTWRARVVQLQEGRIASANLSQAVAQHAYDTIKEADTVLVGLVERIEHGATSDPQDLLRLHQLLAQRVTALPQLHGLFVYDADGAWLANAEPTLQTGKNNGEREYFTYHRSHPNRGPHIGPAIRSKSTNDWIVTVSRRINRPDGAFDGVALATIRMSYFSDFYGLFNIGKAGAIFLATNEGRLLIRRPFDETLLGKDLSGAPLFKQHLGHSDMGTATIKSAIDGVTRINSFRRLQEFPLVVSTALSEDEFLDDWRGDAYRHGIALAIIVAGLGWMGFRLILQIQLRIQTETELLRTRGALVTLNGKLEALAMQDGLTGLGNRRKFDLALQDEFSRATREASVLALIMIDVDCFKQYNDLYGHAAGDECLKAIGKVVQAGPRRAGDMAARYGGEEMVLLLPGTEVAGAVIVAEKIRQAIYALELIHTGNPTGFVTISAGVEAWVPVLGQSEPVELVKAADRWLYRAKADGRNRVEASGYAEV